MLRIAFMGSDAIALPALDWMTGQGSTLARVVAVFTQPDRATGRGQQVRANAVKQWALARDLPVFQPERVGAIEREQLAALSPDLALVMAYGHILKPDFINTPRLGTLNLHTSLLPAYRGASPIQSALCQGDAITGVSLMRIVPQLDAGPVADVEAVAVGLLDTAGEVEAKLAQAVVPLLTRSLPRLADGTLVFADQETAQATFCRRLVKEDGVLDFAEPATVLAARINGLLPWPGCTVPINGQSVKLGLAEALPANLDLNLIHPDTPEPGVVVGADAGGLLVGTGRGVLRLRKLQRPGGRMLPATEFLRGFPVEPGVRLPSRPMPPLVAREPFPRVRG